jgi:lysyl-tRNA synthetase class 2
MYIDRFRRLSPPDTFVRRAVALLTFVVGLINVASVFRPGLVRRFGFLTDVLPGAVVSASAAVSVSVGVVLIGLALNLGRGKRRAWRIAMTLLAAEVVLQTTQAHHVVAVASAILLLVLLLSHRAFIGRSEPVNRSRALTIGASLLAASTVVGWIAVSALDRHEGTGQSALANLQSTLLGFAGITTAVTAPESRESDAVYYLLVALAATTILVTGALILRAPRTFDLCSADDVREMRRLVERFGGDDSLSYFALRDDRPVVWGPGRRTAVSYRHVGDTMLAAGDPLGPPGEWHAAIETFVRVARERSAVPAVVACTEQGAQAWSRFGGLVVLELGDEAVLDARTFTLDGRAMRNVRQAVTRAERAGLTVRCARLVDIEPTEVAHLADLAEAWRGGAIERGFSMALGRVDAERDPTSVAVVAESAGKAQGLLVLVPWGRDGLSLDLMRRDGQSGSGINELMITRLMEAAPELGVDRVSLNFAVFREAIERSERFGAGPLTRLWGGVLRLASRGTQADSLYRFNAKFHPEWERRFLAYPPAGGLPRVSWAYLRAESLVPSLRRRPRAALERPGTGSPTHDRATASTEAARDHVPALDPGSDRTRP